MLSYSTQVRLRFVTKALMLLVTDICATSTVVPYRDLGYPQLRCHSLGAFVLV